MPAVLSIACACGRSQTVECPSIGDIIAAKQQFVGWTYDDHGRARCPECSARGFVEHEAKASNQTDLFAAEAA